MVMDINNSITYPRSIQQENQSRLDEEPIHRAAPVLGLKVHPRRKWNFIQLLGAANAFTCPNEWVTSILGNCYMFVSTRASWNQAQSRCADEGGILADLQDMQEIYWLMGYRAFYKNLKVTRHWVGGFKEDGVWKWKGKNENTTMTIKHWAPGEPNNLGGRENCLELRGSNQQYAWNDLQCKELLPFICERNQI
ncbi:perlucin-like [Watersipora subatra]|uniref:perlucin-like n=1 Tax=Watersipora subatra TaxID=2589382 RepID=UPI00355AFBB8